MNLMQIGTEQSYKPIAKGQKVVTFKTFKRERMKIELWRIYTNEGTLLCHCVQRINYGGSYYTTEREVYAYCEGRNWIKREENPHYAYNCGLNIIHHNYPMLEDKKVGELIHDNKKHFLYCTTYNISAYEKSNESHFPYNLYKIKYGKKEVLFETPAELYAYWDGKCKATSYKSPFAYPFS